MRDFTAEDFGDIYRNLVRVRASGSDPTGYLSTLIERVHRRCEYITVSYIADQMGYSPKLNTVMKVGDKPYLVTSTSAACGSKDTPLIQVTGFRISTDL